MGRQTAQNPLYQPRYNDPAIGQAAGNLTDIAGMLLANGPNAQAAAAAQQALQAAQTEGATQTGRKTQYEADIGQARRDALLHPDVYSSQQAIIAGRTPADQQPLVQTIGDILLGGGTSDAGAFGDARRKNAYDASMNRNGVDFAGPLGIAPEAVSTRQAALKGDALYGTGGEGQILQTHTGDVAQTPVSRANVRKSNAEAAKAAQPNSNLPKPPKDMRYNANGDLELVKGSQTDLKRKTARAKDDSNLRLVNGTIDDTIRSIDQLIGSEDGTIPPHPGLAGFVGSVDSHKPVVFGDTADAAAIHTKLKSEAAIEGLRTVRGTAGAIGSITEREWPILEQARAAINNAQSEKQYRDELANYRNELRHLKGISQQGFDEAYAGEGYDSGGAPAENGLSPAEQQELETLRARFKK